ncbi:MAG: hypothetical protein NTZ17_01325 [Phycisphaerae bacterium]|nr:hypothetical protein [Phycisphaerae bacterium]
MSDLSLYYAKFSICYRPASGTRKEAKLYSPQHNRGLVTLRRVIANYQPRDAMEALFKLLRKYSTNEQFLDAMSRGGQPM